MYRGKWERGSQTAPSSENEPERRSSGMLSKLLFLLIFLVGLGILLYPTLSDRYYTWQYEREVAQWEASRETKDYSPLWSAAESYNRELAERQNLKVSVSEEERAEISTLLNPLGNGMMGYIDIEKINVHLPVYQGTDETQLQSGAGWWIGTSLPTGGGSTHSVITAHTGLVKAKLFTDLDQLVEGDTFTLTILDRVMTYQVDQILVTEPEDFDPLVIVPGEDYVTLYTCTPYGVNTHRLLVRGHRFEAQTEVPEATNNNLTMWFVLAVLLIAFLVFFVVYRSKTGYHGKHEQRKNRR